jgi:hypothetical protein
MAVSAVVIAGCGGDAASPGQRAAVRGLVPGAREIRCERVGAVTRCRAETGNALTGKAWTCEFEMHRDRDGAAYSGTQSCWTSRD